MIVSLVLVVVLAPDRLAHIDLIAGRGGADAGAEEAAQQGAFHRPMKRQARKQARAGADPAAGEGAVAHRVAAGAERQQGQQRGRGENAFHEPSPGKSIVAGGTQRTAISALRNGAVYFDTGPGMPAVFFS